MEVDLSNRLKLAFWCYVLFLLGNAGWGANFLLRSEFTEYHSVAVGMPWMDVPKNFQVLILALIKVAGGQWIAFSLGALLILLIPFRQGVSWAIWTVPLLLLVQSLASWPAMMLVTVNTAATPPWAINFIGIGIALFGLVLSLSEREHQ